MARLSSAVCAMSGVCMFESTVPFASRKCSRVGICSRSEGTFGLSLKKCTLSKVMLMTCWTPLPSWHCPAAEATAGAAGAADRAAEADAGTAPAATSVPIASRPPAAVPPRRMNERMLTP